jgi:A/G-specific adenine glycosylase
MMSPLLSDTHAAMTTLTLHQRFSQPLLNWFDKHGRRYLPWQQTCDAYLIWISEMMLQQTQVKTVIPYFNRFIDRFPDISSLAIASEDDVLAHWSGLGYYSRARNLHKTAQLIQTDFNGVFPSELSQLTKFPGIGPSTAAAITSLAFHQPTAILDGNVKRVLSRYFLVDGLLTQSAVQKKLWQLATDCMPHNRCAEYTQAIMDLGATCCTSKNPNCMECPLQATCRANQCNTVALYPNRAPKKNRPTKHQQFLLLYDNKESPQIYLEKRPPTGIWGSLWCLPMIDMDDCPTTYVSEHYHLHTKRIKEFMTIKHSFTHFHLHMTVVSMHTERPAHSQSPGHWFLVGEAVSLGLAKPIRTIIASIQSLGEQSDFGERGE